MNELIKELAGQAGAGINYTDNGEPSGVHFNKYETFEKFAELIVRECCQINYDFLESYRESSEVNDVIRKHFGVEE